MFKNIVKGFIVYASDSIVPGVNVKLIDPNGDEIESSKFKVQSSKSDDGEDLLEIRIPRDAASFKPGVWKMSVEIETKKKILRAEQDFSWGVLAINTNKATYVARGLYADSNADKTRKRERAYLQMAALDDKGETICNAELELTVTSPSGNKTVMKIGESEEIGNSKLEIGTKADVIYRSGKCGRNNITDVPDYFAYYDVSEVGEYKMELTATTQKVPVALKATGTDIASRTITDTFEAVEAGALPFEIERTGPTRIYPVAEYEMKIRVKANEDFEGSIVENIPDNFKFEILNFKKITNNKISKIKETPDKGISFESLMTRSSCAELPPTNYYKYKLNKNICQEEKFCNNYNIVNNNTQNKNTLAKSEDVFIGPLRTGVPSIDTYLQYNISKKIVKSLIPAAFAAEEEESGYQEIVLAENISLKAGDIVELSYKFDAPDVAPELFLLGQLELRAKKTDEAADNHLVYIEPRVWQIASDGLNKSYIRNDAARTYTQTQNTTGLVGMWDLDFDDYNQTTDTIYGKYGSDDLTAVSDPFLTTGFDGRANSAISFDGIADYLIQQNATSGSATANQLMLSTADGQAFLQHFSTDFSGYAAPSLADKPYMAVIKDAGLDVAWGYGGPAEADTLGEELVTNGDFSAWTGDNPDGWTNGGETAQHYVTQSPEGQCRLVTTDGSTMLLSQNILTPGQLYKYSIDIKTVVAGGLAIKDNISGIDIVSWTTAGVKIGYFVANHNTFPIRNKYSIISDVTFDNVSVKAVTESLGAELVTNGNMETYVGTQDDGITDTFTASWVVMTGTSGIIDATASARSGSSAVKLYNSSDASRPVIYQSVPASAGKVYKITVWHKELNGGTGQIVARNSLTTTILKSVNISGNTSYAISVMYVTAIDSAINLALYHTSTTTGQVYFDDVSIKEVTAPVATGLKLYSTKTGSVQNMAGTAATFAPNEALTYEVRKTDFQVEDRNFTIGLWAKIPATHAGTAGLIAQWDSPNTQGWFLEADIVNDPRLRILARAPGGAFFDIEQLNVLTADTWKFIVVSFDRSGYCKLYVNGVYVNQWSMAAVPGNYSNYETLKIGKRTNYINGSIAKPFIYNRVLSEAEVSNMYNSQKKRFIE